jgi:hypothetical protein
MNRPIETAPNAAELAALAEQDRLDGIAQRHAVAWWIAQQAGKLPNLAHAMRAALAEAARERTAAMPSELSISETDAAAQASFAVLKAQSPTDLQDDFDEDAEVVYSVGFAKGAEWLLNTIEGAR